MDNPYTQSDTQLIPFLRELADLIESKQLSPEKLQRCGEFFMAEKFNEEISQKESADKKGATEIDEDFDAIKFITMGWYMYRIIANTYSPTGSTEHDTLNI